MDANLVTSKLNVPTYASLINAANPENSDRQYIWKSTISTQYFVSKIVDKNNKGMKAGMLRPLSFREIILYGYQYKKGLLESPEVSRKISDAIGKMAERKTGKAKKNNAFINLIHLICDCAKNFFSGHGFKSSITLAKNLSKILSNVDTKEDEESKEDTIKGQLEKENPSGKKTPKNLPDPFLLINIFSTCSASASS